MKASLSLFAIAALAAMPGMPSLAARADLQPASEAAIFAGASACVGATVDPAGQPARLRGWSPAPAGMAKTNGRSVMHGHVLLFVSPGRHGACRVVARADDQFRGRRLLARIEHELGARKRSDAPVVLALPNGETMRIDAGAKRGGATYVQLSVVNAKRN